MSIISTIGRKQPKVRGLFFGMYLFLVIGGATMVYPFLLMISGSTKSAMDIRHFDMVPRFLHDRDWMAAKHLEGLFNESLTDMNYTYDGEAFAFDQLGEVGTANLKAAQAWETFVRETPLPDYAFCSGYMESPQSRTIPSGKRGFKEMLARDFGEDISVVNQQLGTEFADWSSVTYSVPRMYMRRDKPQETTFTRKLHEFMSQSPTGLRLYYSAEGFYRRLYLKARHSGKDTQSQLAGRHLHRRLPADAPQDERDEWEKFVREVLCGAWVRVDATALGDYQRYLRAKYPDLPGHPGLATLNARHGTAYRSFAEVPVYVADIQAERARVRDAFGGDIARFNAEAGTAYASFDELPLAGEPPFSGIASADWDGFLTGFRDPSQPSALHRARTSSLVVHSTEWRFRDWLLSTYGSLAAANAALGTSWAAIEEVLPPQRDAHLAYFDAHLGDLRWEFVRRNYLTVLEYMLFHGRGILNTVIYCGLAILTALLVNPLAAYAMSRYRMPSSYKILLFLMCTMAFPPMVTAIPNFIMLRQFNMLNTFWALILPGMANGYSIFLLKGFFDSLPQELYESAQLDGANEWTLFWQITMGLSKPILAVIALNAFTAAYSNFMYAFVICQDRRMWTMMVWLYEMQQRYGQAVVYASLVIAAIPTFLIFLFCQNIIMRGIVVPSEK